MLNMLFVEYDSDAWSVKGREQYVAIGDCTKDEAKRKAEQLIMNDVDVMTVTILERTSVDVENGMYVDRWNAVAINDFGVWHNDYNEYLHRGGCEAMEFEYNDGLTRTIVTR